MRKETMLFKMQRVTAPPKCGAVKRTAPPRDGSGASVRGRVLGVLVLALLSVGSPAFGQEKTAADTAAKVSETAAGVIFPGEDLTYEVSWMRIPLGSIRTVVKHQQGDGGDKTATVVAYIDTYSGVPFVDVHEVDESTMDAAALPISFRGREKKDDKWKITDYAFDRPQRRLIVRESFADSKTGKDAVLNKIDTVKVDDRCVEAVTLLFFARLNARSAKQSTVPTIVNGKQGTTVINFYRQRTSEEIDAVDYPVDVVELDGEAQFTGILGMTGPFTGWFSNDSAQIPIKAKLKILLGSITVELKKWNRGGWNPPRSSSGK